MRSPAFPSRPAPWLLFAVAAVVAAVLSYPYLGLDVTRSRLDVPAGLHYGVLVVHVFTAAVAVVLGPLQFVPAVRAHRRTHRAIGRCYLLAGVLPSALAAVPVAAWSGNLLTQVSLSTAAVLWLGTGALAYQAARRRDIARHRAWMMRNYALTFLAVTARLLVPLLLLVQVLLGDGDNGPIADRVAGTIPVGQTLGWIVNLAVVEVLLHRRNLRPAHTQP